MVTANQVSCTVVFNTTGTFSYTATDKAGNVDTSANYTYTIDLVTSTLSSFTSSTANGYYNQGDTINITATYSEALLTGGTITVHLATGGAGVDVVLSGTGGTTLTGTYTIGAGENISPLTVASIGSQSVSDVAGNVLNNTTMPGTSITAGSTIVIDTTADPATGTPDLDNASDTGSSNSDNTTSDNTPSFTFSCVTGSTVSLKAGVTVYGTDVCTAGTVTITASTVADGTYSFFAYQTDLALNNSVDSSTISITIDTTAPAAPSTPDLDVGSDSGSSSTDDITNDNTPTMTGVCTSGDVVTLYAGAALLGSTTCAGANIFNHIFSSS